ncbi:sigma-70 family RNA polymerase sigma factor [Kriegella aquimaris]|uniref:RNA polymerase sigma-70 factor, ECF subfamily n=1 Tax=Kriegella aquimaris TaxID=192904 RepID=A0A1G9WV32_9FLAO|nr:sigma-70 family RNA polymerase sigma factor [Kriegella aquimaris]SDM88317.1 RNA polymerase sigma-70 factor, ECF subfamily [Kriegella aquimaris]
MTENLQQNIELVFKKHYKEFCLLSYSYVSSSALAEDIVQDIFVEILAKKGSTPITNLKGYIWRSVKYSSLKQVKNSKKLIPIDDTIGFTTLISEEDNRLEIDLGPKLHGAIAKLPTQCKNVFIICALDGQKYQTAAISLGISVNTVKTQMKKAYSILRKNLHNAYLFLFILDIITRFLILFLIFSF